MHALTLATLTFAAAASAMNCIYTEGPTVRYDVWVNNEINPDEAPGICGGLWDNMKRFGDCATPSKTRCESVWIQDSETERHSEFTWQFRAAASCNPGKIESTWWEATKNNHGALSCPYPDDE